MAVKYCIQVLLLLLCLKCIHGNINRPRLFINYEKQKLSESEERMATLFSETRGLLYSDPMLRALNNGTDPVSQTCRDDFSQIVTDLNRIIPREYATRSK